ncbi:MAG: hypothetical protein K2Y29_11805 [Beijerinckiaceae bacterium]|nr:hypothetical protein [Beijerinckiaceae bacterium]
MTEDVPADFAARATTTGVFDAAAAFAALLAFARRFSARAAVSALAASSALADALRRLAFTAGFALPLTAAGVFFLASGLLAAAVRVAPARLAVLRIALILVRAPAFQNFEVRSRLRGAGKR